MAARPPLIASDLSTFEQDIYNYDVGPTAFGDSTTISLIAGMNLLDGVTHTGPVTIQAAVKPSLPTLVVDGNGNTLTGSVSLGLGSNLTLKNLGIDPGRWTVGGVTTDVGYLPGAAGPVLSNVTLVAYSAADVMQDLSLFNEAHSGTQDSLTIRLAGDVSLGDVHVQNLGSLVLDYNGHSISGAGTAELVGSNVSWVGEALSVNTASDLGNAIALFNSLGAGTQLVVQLGAKITAATLPAVTGSGLLILNTNGLTGSGAGAGGGIDGVAATNYHDATANTVDKTAGLEAAINSIQFLVGPIPGLGLLSAVFTLAIDIARTVEYPPSSAGGIGAAVGGFVWDVV